MLISRIFKILKKENKQDFNIKKIAKTSKNFCEKLNPTNLKGIKQTTIIIKTSNDDLFPDNVFFDDAVNNIHSHHLYIHRECKINLQSELNQLEL